MTHLDRLIKAHVERFDATIPATAEQIADDVLLEWLKGPHFTEEILARAQRIRSSQVKFPGVTMSIDDGFKKMLDGVKQADEGRDEIMRGLEEAWAGRTDLGESVTDLSGQLGELRETVTTLQTLIMAQSEQIRAMRARLNGDTHT